MRKIGPEFVPPGNNDLDCRLTDDSPIDEELVVEPGVSDDESEPGGGRAVDDVGKREPEVDETVMGGLWLTNSPFE